jgi:hypothetical protein
MHVRPVLAKLNQLAAACRAATVHAAAFRGLPADSRAFVADWNGYLTYTAAAMRTMSRALSAMRPLYNEFQRLLRAAYETGLLHSTIQFEKVRQRVLKDMNSRYAGLLPAERHISAERGVERKLVSFVNANQDAQAIIARVNHDYPDGFLAREFRHG